MAEYKIILTGPMGVGKTTALAAVSDIPPVRTEVRNTRPEDADKATTTVAMDFGQVRLSENEVLRVYGTPGQERFAFMREILARGTLGLIVLIDASRADPVADLAHFVEGFDLARGGLPFVVGVTKLDLASRPDAAVERLADWLHEARMPVPCFRCDVRERGQVLSLVDSLLAMIEVH